MYQVVRTLIQQGVGPQRILWLRMDHPFLMELPLGMLVRGAMDSWGATDEDPLYVFLDEVVYAADWDRWLKTFYDERWPIRLVASSSATAAMRKSRPESGVGRWEEHHLTPYLLADYVALRGQPASLLRSESLWQGLSDVAVGGTYYEGLAARSHELMLIGGFPELLTGKPFEEDPESAVLISQRTLRSDAIERAIYKDIPQSFEIGSPLQLERLLYVLAGQTSQLVSPSNIAGQLGSTQPTLDKYLSYLEQTFLIFTLPNYSGSEAARQRRGRKVYFVDVAVRNAALQRGLALLAPGAEIGTLRENMVAAHLHALAMQVDVRLYHWRDGTKREVDLVYDDHAHPLAFEIASSANHSRAGLIAFRDAHPRFADGCFLVAPDAPVMLPSAGTNGIGSFPLDMLMLVASHVAGIAHTRRILPAGPESR